MRKLMWVILHRKTIWIGKPISIYTLLLFVFVNILFVILIKTKFSASTFPESWKHRKKNKRSFCKNNICCLIFNFFPKRLVVKPIWIAEILQLRARFQTAMVSCSRFVRIRNSGNHRRVWTANLLHKKSLPKPGHRA